MDTKRVITTMHPTILSLELPVGLKVLNAESAEDEVAGLAEPDVEVCNAVGVAPGLEHMSKLYQANDAL